MLFAAILKVSWQKVRLPIPFYKSPFSIKIVYKSYELQTQIKGSYPNYPVQTYY